MLKFYRYLENLSTNALFGAFVFGGIAALALPPVHFLPAIFISIPVLLLQIKKSSSQRRAIWIGFVWGLGSNIVGLYWITFAILVDGARWWWLVPLATPALAVPLACFCIPPAWAAWRAAPGVARALSFTGAWVLSEMARSVLLTGFPWNLIGTVWSFDAIAIQGASLAGVYGLSLVTIFVACLPVTGSRKAVVWGAGVACALAIFGAWRLSRSASDVRNMPVLIVQGNIEQQLKWDPEERRRIFQRYLKLTQQGLEMAQTNLSSSEPLIIVWPETASPFLLDEDFAARDRIAAVLPQAAILLSGTVRIERGPDGQINRVFNSLVAVAADGEIKAIYDKSHLVPFGEYMPLAGAIPVRLAAGSMDFSAGPGPVTLDVPGLPPFGALICYEAIFPAAVTAPRRPAWLVNVTNDAWFGRSAGPWQHLSAVRMRSVEEGLPLVRAAQSGVSTTFDSFGRQGPTLSLGVEGVALTFLSVSASPTPFAKFGLILPFGLSTLVLLLGYAFGRGAAREAVLP